MYIVNNIAYADTSMEMMKVKEAKVIDNMQMILTYMSGEKRLFDASSLLDYPAFQSLKNEDIFNYPKIDHGVVTWDNGKIDIAPETMYQNSYKYN